MPWKGRRGCGRDGGRGERIQIRPFAPNAQSNHDVYYDMAARAFAIQLSRTKAGGTHDHVNARKIRKLKPSPIPYWTQPTAGGLKGPLPARLRAVRGLIPFDNGAAVAARLIA